LLSLAILNACATDAMPPPEALDREVDLERFMGDWCVIGLIPIAVPFFSEEGAHNGVESYRLGGEGVIETTYTFRDGGFDGIRSFYDFLGGGLIDRTIEVEFWRVPAARIPRERDGQIAWLYDQWSRVDEWVGHRSGAVAAAAVPSRMAESPG
jgi:hypothetical protein